MRGTSELDVVIATRNRPDGIRRTLEGLTHQSYQGFGVIVVDDGSDPPVSDRLLDDFGHAFDLRLVRLARQGGPARARNAGVRESSAEFIVFIDDDVRPDWRLVEVHREQLAGDSDGSSPIVSFGPFVQPADWTPTAWTRWEARQAKREADAMTEGRYVPTWRQFHTGNNALRRGTFWLAGGFNEDFQRAEDDEFALRLASIGAQFRFQPEALAWHYPKRTLRSWLQIPRAYAKWDVRIDAIHAGSGYLAMKRAELARRHPLLRTGRWCLGWRHAALATPWLLSGAAQALYGVGAESAAMAALSLAYDIAYTSTLRDEAGGSTAAAAPSGAA